MAGESESHDASTTTDSSSSVPKSSPVSDHMKQPQVPAGFPTFSVGNVPMFPIMYPTVVPGFLPLQNQEQTGSGAGIYAVPVHPYMGSVPGLTSNTLIPLTYSIPTASSTDGALSGEHGQDGRQPHAPQRPVVVRRFQFAFQIDLLLILKLAAVIFVFYDGSKQRLMVLMFFALLIYLYQTGALTPLIRWLSQGMHRAAAPPQPRPPVRAENIPGAVGQEVDNAARGEGQPENANQAENEERPLVNENQVEPVGGNGVNWRLIVKEIQMIVVGFITSLLPGFHNVD